MNTILLAIILGVIEGLTEFIPVSSTGHLIIANQFLHFEGDFANLFTVVIQVGAILAAMIYFKDKIIPPIKDRQAQIKYIQLWLKVAVGILPAVFLAFTIEDFIDQYLFNPVTVSIALILGAFLLIFAESRDHQESVTSDDEITFKSAFIVGLFQCLAILLPGMSRSASTIIGGLFTGFSRKLAAEFSFYLAIPALIGASLYKILKYDGNLASSEWIMLGVGTFASFVVAYIVIAFFMNYIRKNDMKIFAYYRIVLGCVILVLHLLL